MKKTLLCSLLFLGLVYPGSAQPDRLTGYQAPGVDPDLMNKGFQWGIGFRATSVLIRNNQAEFNVSLVAAVGLPFGKKEFNANTNFLFPTYHLELSLMRGGFGAPLGTKDYNTWSLEMRNAILMTYGLDNDPAYVARPIPTVLTYSARVLNDPYRVSLRLGAVYIRNFRYGRSQRMGSLGIGVNNFSINYHNDGSFIHGDIGLGDNYDRWYTGSGELAFYSTHPGSMFNQLSLTFARYTGFYPYTFETASDLGLYYVPYPKIQEQLLNQGRWVIGGEFANGIRLEGHSLDHPFWEVQNIIHWLKGGNGMALHPTALDNRIGFGMSYLNRYEEHY